MLAVLVGLALLGAGGAGISLISGGDATAVALADPPSVTLTTPGYSTNVLTGSDVLLALNTTATITSVQYQYMAADTPAAQSQWTALPGSPTPPQPLQEMTLDTTLLSGVTNSNSSDGLYDLRAVVTDSDGDTLVSNTLSDRLVANNSPVVLLSSPSAGGIANNTLTLSAEDETNDPNGNLLGSEPVEFQYSPSGQEDWTTIPGAGSVTAGTNGQYKASFDTTSVPDGSYDFQVVVPSDLNGFTDYSVPVRGVQIDNAPPTVSLTAPASPLQGLVAISATASDPASGIAQVEFEEARAGGSSLAWKPFGTATAPPYSRVLVTQALANGTYDLRAIATDGAGNTSNPSEVDNIVVSNPSESSAVDASVTSVVPPAKSIGMLGTITQSPGNENGETWAYGFTSAAPAEVDGTRLQYTAQGNQLVLLRYSDGGGWQIADVLRNSDGSAFPLLPSADVAAVHVTGSMAPTGEAWLLVTETPTSASGLRAVVGLFHRAPSGQFTLDPELDPTSPSYKPALAAMLSSNSGDAQLRLGYSQGEPLYGVLTAPDQPRATASVASAGGGPPVQINTALEYALLQGDASWSVESVPTTALPASYTPEPGDVLELTQADVTGPDSGWGALTVGGPALTSASRPLLPLLLGRFADNQGSQQWTFAPTGIDALDLTGGVAAAPHTLEQVTPTELRAFQSEGVVWIEANITFQSDGSGGVTSTGNTVVAELDANTGRAASLAATWCTLLPATVKSKDCEATLPAIELSVPDAMFEVDGKPVGVALGDQFVNVFSDDIWSQVAAPGYAAGSIGGSSASTFSGPNEGWLAGAAALGHWTGGTTSPLVSWPLPDRTPLTAVAVPAGNGSDSTESQAVAVGLDGTTLYYNAADGWLPASLPTTWQYAPPPPQASSINLLGVAFDGSTNAFAVGQYGAILRWNGSSWSEDPQSFTLTQGALNAVAFASSGEGWAVGAAGTILHYDGSDWTAETPPADEAGADITSVTVAGSHVYAVAGGNLITREGDGSWQDVAASQLPSDPAPAPGALRLVAGLPDGGVVAAGVNEVLTSQSSGDAFEYAAQPLQGIAVALAPFRQASGELGAFVSVAPPAPNSQDVGGFPAGDGELLRLTDSGWQDLSEAQDPSEGQTMNGDGAVKADPVLAVATDSSGEHAWAVGGYAGTVSAANIGTYAVLSARPAAWDTASVWRYDDPVSAAPPQLSSSSPSLPAQTNTVSFAFFSSPECRWECTAVQDAQPDVNLSAAASQIATYAQQPGGPAFAMFGGNDRGPTTPVGGETWDASEEYAALPSLLAPLGSVPLFGVLGPDDDPGGNGGATDDPGDPAGPWAGEFINSPAPLGVAAAPSGITPVASGDPLDDVNLYYAFDARQNGGTLRVIVLNNASGSLGTDQTAWLASQLADAQADNVPVVVFAAEPLRATAGGASDGTAVATMLANAGVLAVFTTNPSLLNQKYMVPSNPSPGQAQIPEYEGASLGYQQTANNGVDWYFVSVDTASRTVSLDAVPLVGSLALEPLDGLTVARSVTLQFEAVARRSAATIATFANSSTATGDDGYQGYDQYIQIPAASCGSSCISPSYSFTSSDPTIGTFVKASGPGSPYPALNSSGDPIPDAQSGLFCAFNSGTTTVSVTAGLETYSVPVTVEAGDYGPPCGTVYRPGVNKIIYKVGPSVAGQQGNPTAAVAPPPASSVANTVTPTLVLPPALQHPPVVSSTTPPPPVSPPVAVLPPTVVPTPATPVEPTPPGGSPVPVGGVAQSPATARREEKARKHAQQSAYTIRPAGVASDEWFYGLVGGVSVLTLLLVAAGTSRASTRFRPATVSDSASGAQGPAGHPRRRR
jgi:hypothetical protein